ncbi:unnamed protein product [Aphanomyces euteiches]
MRSAGDGPARTSLPVLAGLIAAYFPNLLDNVRLYTITDPLANIPHHAVTINWMLLCSPLRGVIVKDRDWCYVEHQQDVIIDGKKAWLRALKHVDIAACPDLEAKYGIIRGQILRAGFIYMETDLDSKPEEDFTPSPVVLSTRLIESSQVGARTIRFITSHGMADLIDSGWTRVELESTRFQAIQKTRDIRQYYYNDYTSRTTVAHKSSRWNHLLVECVACQQFDQPLKTLTRLELM